MKEQSEITMELLTDIATMIRHVSADYLPTSQMTVSLNAEPPAVTLRIPGTTHEPLQVALKELAEAARGVTDAALPSLPLRYTVVGGSEAAGIVISLKPTNKAAVYGNIIKARLAWLKPSTELLRRRPYLPERIIQ